MAISFRPQILAIAVDHGELFDVDVAVLFRLVSAPTGAEWRAQEQGLVVLERVQIQMKPKFVQDGARTVHEMNRLPSLDPVVLAVELGFDFVGRDFDRALGGDWPGRLRPRAAARPAP